MCNTTKTHCENCGSTDYENLTGNGGYSACCNELIVNGNCRGFHNETRSIDDVCGTCGYDASQPNFACKAHG